MVELISDFVVCDEGKPLSPESARILVSTYCSVPVSLFCCCRTVLCCDCVMGLIDIKLRYYFSPEGRDWRRKNFG